MKFLLYIGIAIVFSTVSFAQDTTYLFTQNIRGKVVDSESRYPIVGAKIKLTTETGELLGAISDEKGDFSILNVPVGKQILIISSIGYEGRELPVILT